MKNMNIEKIIVMDHEVDRIDNLSCHEKIQTTAAANGLECSGFIEINGTGTYQNQTFPISELIDLSIFAPFSKLSETEQFGISLSKYDIKVQGNELHCVFSFEVSGIIEMDEINQQQENESASLEDLLDDSEVVHEKVRYALTYSSDTYASIASRFNIDESILRSLNHNKSLTGRMLILLP